MDATSPWTYCVRQDECEVSCQSCGLRAAVAKRRAKGKPIGRPAVAERPELVARIQAMRGDGMSLQAIADQLTAEGVPTTRGAVRWRPSSVQSAAGYKRPKARPAPRRWPGRPRPRSWPAVGSGAAKPQNERPELSADSEVGRAYSQLRKMLQDLDAARPVNSEQGSHLRGAIAAMYKAEDFLVAAIRSA